MKLIVFYIKYQFDNIEKIVFSVSLAWDLFFVYLCMGNKSKQKYSENLKNLSMRESY